MVRFLRRNRRDLAVPLRAWGKTCRGRIEEIKLDRYIKYLLLVLATDVTKQRQPEILMMLLHFYGKRDAIRYSINYPVRSSQVEHFDLSIDDFDET